MTPNGMEPRYVQGTENLSHRPSENIAHSSHIQSDFSRAFASFKKLEHLSTSSQFGHTPDRLDPRKREALVWVAARAAPRLSTILWGDDRIGCVVSRAEQRAVRRDERGLVVGIDMNGSWGVGDLEEFWRHLS